MRWKSWALRIMCRSAVLVGCCLTATALGQARSAGEAPLSRISLGSCAKLGQPQPIWEAIVVGQPELFVFLGDNIYGDSPDMDVLRAKYAMLNEPRDSACFSGHAADLPGRLKL